jgi:NTP pyrophosphatase (non-canonical NTP hydrolase)
MTDNPDEIYNRALDAWGHDAQMDMVIEEMSELIKAILKYRRKPHKDRAMDVAEELADVIIMLRQLEIAMERNYPSFVNWKKQIVIEKLQRVETMLITDNT